MGVKVGVGAGWKVEGGGGGGRSRWEGQDRPAEKPQELALSCLQSGPPPGVGGVQLYT